MPNDAYRPIALLTDADGTLFDSFPLYNRAIDDALLSRGLATEPYENYYKPFNDRYDIIPGTSWGPIFTMLLEYLGQDTGRSDEVLAAFYEAAVRRIGEAGPSLLLTHARPVLEAVAASGGRTFVHSGTSRPILDALLSSTGLDSLVDWSVCGNELPAKDGYARHKEKMVAMGLGRFADFSPVVLGDTKADVWAANALGIPVALIYHGYPKDPTQLDFGFFYPYADQAADGEEVRELVGWLLASGGQPKASAGKPGPRR